MGWKKLLSKPSLPDGNDPHFKGVRDSGKVWGKKFAKFFRLDRCAYHMQNFANKKPKAFLSIVITLVIVTLALNIVHMVSTIKANNAKPATFTIRVPKDKIKPLPTEAANLPSDTIFYKIDKQ